MNPNDMTKVELRLSRIPLFLLFIILSILCLFALDIGFFHRIIPGFQADPGKELIFIGFIIFMAGGGGAGALQMLWYLILPPVTLRADVQGIWFGTGLRYRLYCIPWKYVKTIGAGIDPVAVSVQKQAAAGLQISFTKTDEIPGSLATSIGIFYQFYTLTLNYFYMNRKNIQKVTDEIKLLNQHYHY